jgi:1-piperideine-2-carboxylate/1-pyrroline-2-carboxylate reductase [NAD(P)H]
VPSEFEEPNWNNVTLYKDRKEQLIDARETTLSQFGAFDLRRSISDVEAVAALHTALLCGHIDPEDDPPRVPVALRQGEFLLMPSEYAGFAGVKVATVAPANPARGRPRIQGTYLLFDSNDLRPIAIMDAGELTLIRTPAVTTLAVRTIREGISGRGAGPIESLAVIGAGPQADRHIRAMATVIGVNDIAVITRAESSADGLVNELRSDGIAARRGSRGDLRSAGVVLCATSSSTPVFEDTEVGPEAIVAAIGSHGLNSREVPGAFVRGANVVVESVRSVFLEGGDLIPARSPAEWRRSGLTTLRDLVTGNRKIDSGRPHLYTAVGMSWQDLVIAAAVMRARLDPYPLS